LGTAAQVRAGYRFTDRIVAQTQFEAGLTVLSRLHIQPAGNEFHIYKDFGNVGSLQFAMSLRAEIEVLQVRVKTTKGTARTDFYKLNLDDDLEKNPELPLALAGLRELLTHSRIDKIKLFSQPDRLEHQISEKFNSFRFLFWNSVGLSQEDKLKLTRANETEPEYYLRRLFGRRGGDDFQTLGVDLVNEIIAETTDQQVTVPNSITGDPGDTLFGKSNARYSYFEGQLSPGNGFIESFVGIVYRWRGWSASPKRLSKIISEFSGRFNFQFFHPNVLSQVKKAELYAVNLRIFVYDQGVWNLVYLPLQDVSKLLDNHFSQDGSGEFVRNRKNQVLRSFHFLQQDYQKAMSRKKFNEAGDKAVRLVSLLESVLDNQGLIKAVGGPENILIQPLLTGFFRGEDGKMAEIPIEGNDIGQIGSLRALGPMTSTQNELGMTESEFFVYWLLQRI